MEKILYLPFFSRHSTLIIIEIDTIKRESLCNLSSASFVCSFFFIFLSSSSFSSYFSSSFSSYFSSSFSSSPTLFLPLVPFSFFLYASFSLSP